MNGSVAAVDPVAVVALRRVVERFGVSVYVRGCWFAWEY
jgi:hypothetical protein